MRRRFASTPRSRYLFPYRLGMVCGLILAASAATDRNWFAVSAFLGYAVALYLSMRSNVAEFKHGWHHGVADALEAIVTTNLGRVPIGIARDALHGDPSANPWDEPPMVDLKLMNGGDE